MYIQWKSELTRQDQSAYFIKVFAWEMIKMCKVCVCKFEKGEEIVKDVKRKTTQVVWKLKKSLDSFQLAWNQKKRIEKWLVLSTKISSREKTLKHWVIFQKFKWDVFK